MDYTPTTEEVRNGYVGAGSEPNPYVSEDERAEFDCWLAEVKAQAWKEGFDAGEKDYAVHSLTGQWDTDCTPNPYRQGETE